jgi:hypothetical protein
MQKILLLNKDQSTFRGGEVSPFSNGLTKGIGNLSPAMPRKKCVL